MISAFKRVSVLIELNNQNSFFGRIRKLRNRWDNSNLMNSMRRYLNPMIIRLKYELKFHDHSLMKLHLGCGNNHKDGFVNIDWRKTGATDIVCDIRKLP